MKLTVLILAMSLLTASALDLPPLPKKTSRHVLKSPKAAGEMVNAPMVRTPLTVSYVLNWNYPFQPDWFTEFVVYESSDLKTWRLLATVDEPPYHFSGNPFVGDHGFWRVNVTAKRPPYPLPPQ